MWDCLYFGSRDETEEGLLSGKTETLDERPLLRGILRWGNGEESALALKAGMKCILYC